MKTTKTSRLARLLVASMVVCMLVCLMLPTAAFAANDAVNEAKNGVFQVNLVYTDDQSNNIPVSSGTGFLINDNTLITAFHVVHLDDEDLEYLVELTGKTVAEIKSRLSATVTITRDVQLPTTILTESQEMDFSVLRLSQSLQGKTPLKIRNPEDALTQADNVWAIGFPDISSAVQTYNTYTSNDATITHGTVNKIGLGTESNTNFIQTSCDMDFGNSGGPMVDENGYVVGVCYRLIQDAATTYYYAVDIAHVTEVLTPLGIVFDYGSIGAAPVEPDPVVTEAPETQAPTEAPTVAQPVVDPTLPTTPEPESNNTMILIIAAVAVVIIVVVVVVLVAGGKKKPAPAPAPAPMPRPTTPPVNTGFTPAPTYPTQDAGETTVLGGGAGETTVLSRNTVSGGTLTRKRTGETVNISSDQFVIGRERKSVNYCIADNSSISRNHVRLTVRGGITYLTDLNAANGTFVNGVKVQPRQEIALKNGDKITLADEDLEYKN